MDASAKPRPKLLAALRKPTSDSSDSESGSASEDEGPASTVVAKPRTISTPRPTATVEESKEDDESDGEDAYELMKKRLAANKKPTTAQEPPQEAQQGTSIVAIIESSEDEDEMPVRANGRNPAAKRTKTPTPRASPSPSVRSRRSSPGLFVTPEPSPAKKQSRRSVDAGSDSDDSSRPTPNADLQERVRRIREERLAKQQEEETQQTKPKKLQRRRADQPSGSDTDGESGRKLTQQAKPTRRAGKKAMEAMARDQQRISRNMQLTHQAKTKKRFTTQDLFKKFNYRVPGVEVAALPTPEPSSAVQSPDAEANRPHDITPTSPPRQKDASVETISTEPTAPTTMPDEQDDMETPRAAKVDKGKGRAPEFQHLPVHPWMKMAEPITVQNAAIDVKKSCDDAMVELSDSEDDLQVQPKSRFPVFDRLPTRKQHEGKELVHLRALAQLMKSPQKGRKGQKSVSRGEMEYALALKARQQTAKAKEERIADLIKRGHNPETEEENEKRQAEIDDMVALFEKQRQEDLELGKMERKEAKKNGETIDDLPSSDEEDGDYVGSGEEDANDRDADLEPEAEVELSGSEDEEVGEGEEDEEAGNANSLIDDVADEDDEPEEMAQTEQIDGDVEMEDDDTSVPVRRPTVNRARNKRVIDDEDESDAEASKPASPTQQSTQNEAAAAFGFGNGGPGLGLTQMFAGTMAELESGSQSAAAVDTEQNSLDFLRSLPETQPGANFSQASDFIVSNSQSMMSPQRDTQTGVDSQFSLGISQLVKNSPAFSRTQLEDFEPTQDAGFSFSRSPAGLAQPPSTVDTVMMAVAESPIKQKKGKLQRRRQEAAVELSDVEEDLVGAEEEELSEDDIQLPPKPSKDAFQKMQKAAKKAKAMEEFNKKKSMAREVVVEQAEESEDEYAGLGGASDDEEGEEDEDLKDMIDHSNVTVDERKIAAFYA
jgi:mediator of replication checkpoint protein 1